ncbi:16S rRNA (guanine(527)-N(7))-methyltransferase RsmG [Enterococcus timonensis]|uniref:16S rRNA (guanine(527)-N(7))-methyltransferase RsmG n=1 Tax=Enterococcus timonensis TaxID=1852364 RepID=UPI0008D9F47B|nr:16S rRNA (guanine(527)-N(7))-methyltransferase RsmG [Enterococcus timonensis]
MTPEEFQVRLAESGLLLTQQQMAQFATYFSLLVEWNEKINLTTITEETEVYEKHFYDSLLLGLTDEFSAEDFLCDVGSGAGFPSLPLKIAFPTLKVVIVDSLQKRVNFLQTVVDTLQLKEVAIYHDRAETFGQNPKFRQQFDLVTARAVARLNVLSELCLPLVKVGGKFIPLKAKQGQIELLEAANALKILGGHFEKELQFHLPVSGDLRELFVFTKVKDTAKKYPRKPGTPNKQPL